MTEEKKGLLGRAVDAAKTETKKQISGTAEHAEQQRLKTEYMQRQQAGAAEAAQQQAARTREQTQQMLAAGHAGVEYWVEQLRTTLVGDKIKTDALTSLLNSRAVQGWKLKQVVPAAVTGRVGPGGTEGLLVVFERDLVR